MAELILSAFSDEYADGLEKQCQALKKFGIRYMEIRHADGKNVSLFTESDAVKVRKMLDSYGLKVSSVGSPIGKTLPEQADPILEERVFSAATILGAKYVRIFSFYSHDTDKSRRRDKTFAALEPVAALGEKYGILPCHENEANIYGESPENCLDILRFFGGKIGCVFDMGNFVLDGYDAWDAYLLLRDRIDYFHVKDALKTGAVVPPGKGEAKIKEILYDYRNRKENNVFITLEPHLQTFSGFNALLGKSFDNPYKYKNKEEAFTDAVNRLSELL